MTKLNAPSRTAALAAVLTLAPALAHAHPGHDAMSFSSGLAHPLHGLDHLLAMVAVGLWAVQLGGRAVWLVPGAFVAAMTVGSALGMSGMPLPFVEQGILGSVFILGLLIAMASRLGLGASVALVSLFAVFHGHAHGAEAPANAAALTYGLGFAFSTAALHGCGILAGLGLRDLAQASWIRLAGVAVIAVGLVSILG
ncbi:HupE/UreJ family protein [Verrucomicrobiota bacterium sgz303538]